MFQCLLVSLRLLESNLVIVNCNGNPDPSLPRQSIGTEMRQPLNRDAGAQSKRRHTLLSRFQDTKTWHEIEGTMWREEGRIDGLVLLEQISGPNGVLGNCHLTPEENWWSSDKSKARRWPCTVNRGF